MTSSSPGIAGESALNPTPISAGGLPAPDLTVGLFGGFGVYLQNGQTFPGDNLSSIVFDSAYTLDSSNATPDSVDNSYMSWDSTNPTQVTVKQAGWYAVSLALFPDIDTVVPITIGLDNGLADGTPVDQVVPNGLSAELGVNYNVLMYIVANSTGPVDLAVPPTDDFLINQAWVIFIPLFSLAP